MARTDFRSVDEYIASQPEAVQGILERVRGIIRKAVPDAEEVISYKNDPLPALRARPIEVDRTHREVSREGNRRAPEGEDDRPE